MIRIGLTGSIGMGKSTTAKMFADHGVPVHDADASVHSLYEGKAVPLINEAFPGTVVDGKVDRALLSKKVLDKPDAMKRLEEIVHPLVHEEERTFLDLAKLDGHPVVLLDIPLLFETNAHGRVDVVVVVTADADIQRERVLSRPGMTEDRFQAILKKQVPDADKRERADFLIDTGLGMDAARQRVGEILQELQSAQLTISGSSGKTGGNACACDRTLQTGLQGERHTMREISFDTETTGLNPRGGDRLVEIGGVELINHIPTGNSYHVYINPERDMPEEAFRVHGLSEEFLSDKPLFAEVADKFLEFVGDATLVIHNAAFDMGFINMELERAGRRGISNGQVLDTLEIARRKHPTGPEFTRRTVFPLWHRQFQTRETRRLARR